MTQWVDADGSGRDRGPVALARAWIAVIARPRRFFGTAVAPGDQAPGLTFLAAVVFVEEAIRLLVVPDAYPVFGGRPLLSALVWLAAVTVLVAPVGVHLMAALQTLLLAASAPDRAGVSETIQVLCYATAPCVLAGLPSPWVGLAVAAYGAWLYLLGLGLVHDLGWVRRVAVGALPAALVFGVAFRGIEAGRTVGWLLLESIRTALG